MVLKYMGVWPLWTTRKRTCKSCVDLTRFWSLSLSLSERARESTPFLRLNLVGYSHCTSTSSSLVCCKEVDRVFYSNFLLYGICCIADEFLSTLGILVSAFLGDFDYPKKWITFSRINSSGTWCELMSFLVPSFVSVNYWRETEITN